MFLRNVATTTRLIPMTNAALVQEICRAIRGIAQNYRPGLDAIRRQLDALDPSAATQTVATPDLADLPRTPTDSAVKDSQPQAVKRGPGRPRKNPTDFAPHDT